MVKLFAPTGYSTLTPEQHSQICNGMGARDSTLAKLIPNSMWWLDVTEAANVHDYMYHFGATIEHKAEADRVFLNNLMRLINSSGGWLAMFRRRQALAYYESVLYLGGPAFWANKQEQ